MFKQSGTKLRVMFALIGIIIFVVGVSFLLARDAILPRVAVEQSTVDVGKVDVSSTTEVEFKLKNLGLTALDVHISNVSCHCTVPEGIESPIPPGKTGVVRAKITAPEYDAAFGSSILIFTNDPATSTLLLHIQGQAESYADALPSSIDLQDIESDKLPLVSSFQIYPGKRSSRTWFYEVKMTSANDLITVESSRKDNVILGNFTISNAAPIGVLRSQIIVTWPTQPDKKLTIPIVANIHGQYRIFPLAFDLHASLPNQKAEGSCTIDHLDAGDVVEVKSIDDAIKSFCECRIEMKGEKAILQVAAVPKSVKSVEGMMHIAILKKNGHTAALQIPVLISVGY